MASPNPDDYNGGALVGTAACLLALTYISVALRAYVRAFLTKNFQADDWLMLAAQVIFTLSCSFILVGVSAGIGRHNKTLPQKQEIQALMWQALAAATYVLNMMFIKLSIAVFLLRLAVHKRYSYTLWASIVVVGIWSTVAFFWDLFQCNPVQAQWDYTIPGLKCASGEQVISGAYSISVMTILTDFLYAFLPIPMIWNVKMSTQAKITVTAVLGLGIFASIATIVRLTFLADLADTDDLLFATTDAMVWTLIEPGVAIVASSLVTIRPLLKAMRIPGFTSADQSGATGGRSADYYNNNNNKSLGTNRSIGRGGGGAGGGGTMTPGSAPGDMALLDMDAVGQSKEEYDHDDHGYGHGYGYGPPPRDHMDRNRAITATGKGMKGRVNNGLLPVPIAAPPAAAGRGDDGAVHRLSPTAKSEIFVIEGPRRLGQGVGWSDSSSALSSGAHSDDLEGLEAHSQHDGKVGLGGR